MSSWLESKWLLSKCPCDLNPVLGVQSRWCFSVTLHVPAYLERMLPYQWLMALMCWWWTTLLVSIQSWEILMHECRQRLLTSSSRCWFFEYFIRIHLNAWTCLCHGFIGRDGTHITTPCRIGAVETISRGWHTSREWYFHVNQCTMPVLCHQASQFVVDGKPELANMCVFCWSYYRFAYYRHDGTMTNISTNDCECLQVFDGTHDC